MSRVDLDISGMTEDDIRSELESIKARMALWRRLNELYTRKDGEVPVLQTTLERWILHDQFADSADFQSTEALLRRQLWAELDRFDEQCGTADTITDQMRAEFDCAVTRLSQKWLYIASDHEDMDFSVKEQLWAQEDPAHAASWLWEGPVPPPRLGPLRKALEARKEALCAALGEPLSDDDEARTAVIAEPPQIVLPETGRHSDVMAAPTQKRKLAEIRDGSVAPRPKRTCATTVVYDEGDPEESKRSAKGELSPLIARRIVESGLKAGAIAQIPCDQCAIGQTDCKLRFKANTGLPGACQRCHAKNSKCSGGDWRGPSRLIGRRDMDAADTTGVEELRREVAALRESVHKLTSHIESQNTLLVEQDQRLHGMGTMVEALLGMARSQQGRVIMK